MGNSNQNPRASLQRTIPSVSYTNIENIQIKGRSKSHQVFRIQLLQSPDLTYCANACHAVDTFCRQQINSDNNLCIATDTVTGHVSVSPAILKYCAVVI